MSPQGGSFPYSAWMKEGVETRTERVKRLERERVLDEIKEQVMTVIVGHASASEGHEVELILDILKELREGEE